MNGHSMGKIRSNADIISEHLRYSETFLLCLRRDAGLQTRVLLDTLLVTLFDTVSNVMVSPGRIRVLFAGSKRLFGYFN